MKISEYLKPGCRVHLVGIGGVSMRPLGLVLKGMGMVVTGSDMNASGSTQELEEAGIPVSIGHSAQNIVGAEFNGSPLLYIEARYYAFSNHCSICFNVIRFS